MKYFVFSDVHGFYNILIDELIKQGFDENNPHHMLISLGDNFDRGYENYLMFQFLKRMKSLNKIILIKGNHEDLLMKMIDNKKASYADLSNGTYSTIEEFSKIYFNKNIFFFDFPSLYKKLKEDGLFELINSMVNYFETPNYIFTHGFIPINEDTTTYKNDWRNCTNEEFCRAFWLNGMDMNINYHIKEPNKKIVFGHWHSSYGNVRKIFGLSLSSYKYKELEFSNLQFFEPYENRYILAIDSCCAFSQRINVVVIED